MVCLAVRNPAASARGIGRWKVMIASNRFVKFREPPLKLEKIREKQVMKSAVDFKHFQNFQKLFTIQIESAECEERPIRGSCLLSGFAWLDNSTCHTESVQTISSESEVSFRETNCHQLSLN